MNDMQDRIERAAAWLHFDNGAEVAWANLPKAEQDELRGTASGALAAAFPELFDTPTHWIAPMEATEEMLAEAVEHGSMSAMDDWETHRQGWKDMRTAYLNQKDSE